MSYYLGIASGLGASFALNYGSKLLFSDEKSLQGLSTCATTTYIANFVRECSPFWKGFSEGATFGTYAACHFAARSIAQDHLPDYQKVSHSSYYNYVNEHQERNFIAMCAATGAISQYYPSGTFMLNLGIAALLGYSAPFDGYAKYKKLLPRLAGTIPPPQTPAQSPQVPSAACLQPPAQAIRSKIR